MACRHLIIALLAVMAVPSAQAREEPADRKAADIERQMTDEERYALVWGYMPVASRLGPSPAPAHIKPSAGYFPPIARLGFPGLHETDASLGITNPKLARPGDVATALPSGLALAASFNADLAFRSGAMIGGEARAKGFNVLLAGGVNLTRDWYGGRNFEYLGEDPLLSGTLAGQSIRGIQTRRVVATAKHFVLNAQETLRHSLDARIDEAALRESDLLAFQIAIEQGQPGAIMCAYNRINGTYGCSNDWLLNRVLRKDWGYKGWVMSGLGGATHSARDMLAGLDQESGAQLDKQVWFDKPLREAIAKGEIGHDALSTSVRRILRSVYAVGADAPIAEAPIDYAGNAAIARQVAEEGMVLLKNDGALPLAKSARSILVIGRFADRGVWSGGGSSQVNPVGGAAARVPLGGSAFLNVNGFQTITPSSPLEALRKQLPEARIEFDSGYSPELAAARAAMADLVIVFANQWQVESLDDPGLSLPEGQDDLIEYAAAANRNTVVVLETGNPVAMPWLGKVRSVVQAWYSGQDGGTAIANVLTGKVNPSGRLPMTFPASADQAPRAKVPGLGMPDDGRDFAIEYAEGANVGYRWYAGKDLKPLFPFGFGLSYTSFSHGPLAVSGRNAISASLEVTNTGEREGAEVVQIYLVSRNGAPMRRLVAFGKVSLKPGESRKVTLALDKRLLADWSQGGWTVPAGVYGLAVGRSATDIAPASLLRLKGERIAP